MESDNFVVKALINDVYIKPKNKFCIPRFQRQYAWEEEQIIDFWETINSTKPTFLGTIIFDVKDKKKKNVIEIVDGQQRYLTIQILGAALRNIAYEKFKTSKNSIFEDLGKGIKIKLLGAPDDYEPKKFDYYLQTGDSIKDFFYKYIQNENHDEILNIEIARKSEEERVKKAYLELFKSIEKELNMLSEFEQISWLKEFIDKKLAIHFFVKIEIAEEGLAYEVFEAVNAKGVDLSVADLIKNQVFKHVVDKNNNNLDEAKEKWAYILEVLADNDFSIKDFISYYWSSKYKYESDKNLYQAIIKKLGNNKELWRGFLNDLANNVDYLHQILQGNYDGILVLTGKNKKEAGRLYQSLRVLRNIKAKTWIILYLTLFRNFVVNESPYKNTLNKKWTIIEKFTFMYFHILNLPGNWYFKTICSFAEKVDIIDKNRFTNKEFASLFSTYLFKPFNDKMPNDNKEFIEGFLSINYKDDERSRIIIRYVLNEIEEKMGGKHNEGYSEDKVNIEHILPQNPKQWGLSKKDIKDYVNQIGNLTLLGIIINGELGDKDYDEKMKILLDHNTSINMVKDLVRKCQTGEYTFKNIQENKDFSVINQRSNEFAEKAFAIWCVDLKAMMGRS